MALSRKCFMAFFEFAHVRLDARVDSHVGFQVAVLGECFMAYSALKWLLIGVGTNVNLETSTSLILLPTILTLMGLLSRMNQNVSGQVSFGDERLTATLMWAIVRSLAGMDAQVSLQITCFLKLKHALRERAE